MTYYKQAEMNDNGIMSIQICEKTFCNGQPNRDGKQKQIVNDEFIYLNIDFKIKTMCPVKGKHFLIGAWYQYLFNPFIKHNY